jgi:MFS family permease
MPATTAQPTAESSALPPEVRRAVLALIIGGIAAILDTTIVTIALHTLVIKLHSTVGTIQWVSTAYLLALAVAIPVTGWAEGRWGGKRAWMAALLIFVGGSVLCAVSWNDTSLIAFRVLQGFGAGLIFPLMQTLAVRAAGGRASSNLIATISLPLALGPILGPVLGGLILNWLSWRWLFLINVPVIAVGLVLAWRFLPADHPSRGAARPRLDVTGLVLLAAALVGILLGLSNLSQDGGIDHASVLGPLLAGLVVLAAALLLIPQGVGSLVSRFVVGKLVARFGASTVTIATFLLAALATVPFAFAGPRTSLWWLSAVLLVRGFGIGAVLIPPMSVAYDDIGPADIPHATMNIRIAQQVGASFGVAIVAVVLQSLLAHGAVSAFHTAFWWAFGIAVIAFVPALALPAARPSGTTAAARPAESLPVAETADNG